MPRTGLKSVNPARGPAQRPASRMRLSRFAINTHMKLCFAGATHADQSRVRERKTKTAFIPYSLFVPSWRIVGFFHSFLTHKSYNELIIIIIVWHSTQIIECHNANSCDYRGSQLAFIPIHTKPRVSLYTYYCTLFRHLEYSSHYVEIPRFFYRMHISVECETMHAWLHSIHWWKSSLDTIFFHEYDILHFIQRGRK
jgi:hypothetical protein